MIEKIYRQKFFASRIRNAHAIDILIEGLIQNHSAFKMFYLWGLHKKKVMDCYDRRALHFLLDLVQYVSSKLHCSTSLTMVLADSHARVNNVPEDSISLYCKSAKECFDEMKWDTLLLSHLWAENGLTISIVDQHASCLADNMVNHSASVFAQKYYFGDDKVFGAKRYVAARILEKPILEKKFKDFVHVTAADPINLSLQPSLPFFHVWTVHRGRSVKPWFVDGSELCAG